jgi:hypothetical protein
MITAIERYLLESIKKGNNSLLEIHLDTELDPSHIKKLVHNLRVKKYCDESEGLFYIAENKKIPIKLSQRVIELGLIIKNNIRNSILSSGTHEFQMRKVFLKPSDEKIYQSMLFNLDSFLKHASLKGGKTAKEKIIFWGDNTYQNIISDLYDTHSIT